MAVVNSCFEISITSTSDAFLMQILRSSAYLQNQLFILISVNSGRVYSPIFQRIITLIIIIIMIIIVIFIFCVDLIGSVLLWLYC